LHAKEDGVGMILEMKRYLDEPIDEAREWF